MLALALSVPLMLVGGLVLDAWTHDDDPPDPDPDPVEVMPIE